MRPLCVVLISLSILIGILILDYVCVRYLKLDPFVSYMKEEGDSKVYNSLFYKQYHCKLEDGGYKKYFASKGEKYACPLIEIKEERYNIIDETENCDTAIEKFYEDEFYICEYNCIKSDKVFLVYKNGTKINIKTVIEEGIESIEDLINKGVPCSRKGLE